MPGPRTNLKLTTPEDMDIVRALVRSPHSTGDEHFSRK